MINYTIHPEVYHTNRNYKGLINMLEDVWVRNHTPGTGSMFLISGFSNYNGGIRFYDTFKNHIDAGGQVTAVLGGKTSQRLSSKQVVEKLLEIGVDVHLVNRNRLLHMKCYGVSSEENESLIISSGNFTGPGMSANIESSLIATGEHTREMNFTWDNLMGNLLNQRWDYHKPTLDNLEAPAWSLLYDELRREVVIDEDQRSTLIMTLSANDTSRIEGRVTVGTQYFFLSKYSYDFFPALTILNNRGRKRTYSALIRLHYKDLDIIDDNCRVTFEAENNLDFRLGTGKLMRTGLASEGDIMALSRIGDSEYELRIYRQETDIYTRLREYAINFIGNRGKIYGYIDNNQFERIVGVRLR
ncbi:hypothetical protein [Ascidiimonas sp. W6]|uniref:hypothetical protein n=1 Tax=Ascidiimonas meishanensis TaxID=3128903 RepID=UPI0030EB4947